MAIFSDPQRNLAQTLASIVAVNPFLPERIDLERRAMGRDFVEAAADWNLRHDADPTQPNIRLLQQRTQSVIDQAVARIAKGAAPADGELETYESLVMMLLYYRYHQQMAGAVAQAVASPGRRPTVAFYDDFVRDATALGDFPAFRLPLADHLPNLFAIYFQIYRAFYEVFTHIIGVSPATVRLRAAVWQSLFSHDMHRYRRVLHKRTADLTTLITGPSGTGKELVARAIGLSRYIPFDPKSRTFTENFVDLFHPLNISALSPTLVESELFGHRRGAFTGAVVDRKGWLEECSPLGTVFLDEIGELDPSIQVKLLRVLQAREFQRIGDTKARRFEGKIIAATNRDLPAEMAAGRFRADFFYRICSDMIATPTLREQLHDAPEQLGILLLHIATRVVGVEEASSLAAETREWIERKLPPDYAWPGNVRELEQCLRNVMIRQEYRPVASRPAGNPAEELAAEMMAGSLTADELLRRYCTLVYARERSYERAAAKLGLDRRTVRAHVDKSLLSEDQKR